MLLDASTLLLVTVILTFMVGSLFLLSWSQARHVQALRQRVGVGFGARTGAAATGAAAVAFASAASTASTPAAGAPAAGASADGGALTRGTRALRCAACAHDLPPEVMRCRRERLTSCSSPDRRATTA